MCHKIFNTKDGNGFLYSHKFDCLVGEKIFVLSNNRLAALVASDYIFDFHKTKLHQAISFSPFSDLPISPSNESITAWVHNCKITKQPIEFGIPIVDFSPYNYFYPSSSIEIDVGCFISPFIVKEDNEHQLFPSNLLSIPVLFKYKDVTFYDGSDVSVSRFFISPDIFEEDYELCKVFFMYVKGHRKLLEGLKKFEEIVCC